MMNSQRIQRRNNEFNKKEEKIARETQEERAKSAAEKVVMDRNKLSLQRELLIPYHETRKQRYFSLD
jgi:hypothetical protein